MGLQGVERTQPPQQQWKRLHELISTHKIQHLGYAALELQNSYVRHVFTTRLADQKMQISYTESVSPYLNTASSFTNTNNWILTVVNVAHHR